MQVSAAYCSSQCGLRKRGLRGDSPASRWGMSCVASRFSGSLSLGLQLASDAWGWGGRVGLWPSRAQARSPLRDLLLKGFSKRGFGLFWCLGSASVQQEGWCEPAHVAVPSLRPLGLRGGPRVQLELRWPCGCCAVCVSLAFANAAPGTGASLSSAAHSEDC